MKNWLLLIGAIVFEVIGTLSLRASLGNKWWIAVIVTAYLLAFTLLGLALRANIPVGVAYGIWGASGVALVAIFGFLIFGERLSVPAMFGVAIIIGGVYLVQTGSSGHGEVDAIADPEQIDPSLGGGDRP